MRFVEFGGRGLLMVLELYVDEFCQFCWTDSNHCVVCG